MADLLGDIGTLAWTRRTNGRLTRSERARYIAATVAEIAKLTPRLAAYRLGRGSSRRARITEEDLRVPDSRVAREAAEHCEAELSPSIMEHNFRSFLFARALGKLGAIAHDEELLFVATMFHDLGAVEPDLSDGGRCFTLNSAAGAAGHLEASGAGEARRDAASEAITLHINPVVPISRGPEAHLMHDGVLLDAVALRAWDIEPAGVDLVRSRHPRLGFSQEATRILRAQARGTPGCRTAAAFQAGFGLSVRTGPWQD